MHVYPTLPMLMFLPAWLNACLNATTFGRLPKRPAAIARSRVSILVPARNEAKRITPLLTSFLALDDRLDLELLVYDDDSTDDTALIVATFCARDDRIRLLRGQGVPPGWAGKTHALHELAFAAGGDWLVFTDADVAFEPGGLERALATAIEDNLDVLSLYPQQTLGSLAEQLFVPQMVFTFYLYAPQWLASRGWRVPVKPINGQFNLWRRTAYFEVGGYASIPDAWLDDMAMGRRLATRDSQVRYRSGVGVVRCRMYNSFAEVWRGFAKHQFDAYGLSAAGFLSLLVYQLLTHVSLLVFPLFTFDAMDWLMFGLWLFMVVSVRAINCVQAGGGWLSGVFDPVVAAFAIANALESLRQYRQATSSWKGRVRGRTPP